MQPSSERVLGFLKKVFCDLVGFNLFSTLKRFQVRNSEYWKRPTVLRMNTINFRNLIIILNFYRGSSVNEGTSDLYFFILSFGRVKIILKRLYN